LITVANFCFNGIIFIILELESDCSASRQAGSGAGSVDSPVSGHNSSPTLSVKSSILQESDTQITTIRSQNDKINSDLVKNSKSSVLASARKFSLDTPVGGTLKHTQSASVLSTSEPVLRKNTVSFSNFDEISSINTSLSTMSVKSKNGAQKGKTKTGTKTSSSGATKREREKTMKIDPQKSAINKAAEEAARIRSEESLRWEFKLDDEDQELERIRVYKINRRKRYLAAAQEKGLGWVVNYGNNGSPLVDESVMEVNDREPVHTSVTDFSPVRNILASQRNTPMNLGGEIAC
jgi:hypothetical protein